MNVELSYYIFLLSLRWVIFRLNRTSRNCQSFVEGVKSSYFKFENIQLLVSAGFFMVAQGLSALQVESPFTDASRLLNVGKHKSEL